MFMILIKLASSGFGPCKKIMLILIQIILKVLVLVFIVSLSPLSDDVDNGESYHAAYVVA